MAVEQALPSSHCQRCDRDLNRRLAFAFKARPLPASDPVQVPSSSAAGEVVKCFRCALRHWPMLKRSGIAALVVGTILTLLNQGDILLAGQWHGALHWKIPLTYCVPFLVATYGALVNSRR